MNYKASLKHIGDNNNAYFDIRRAFDINEKRASSAFKELVWKMGYDIETASTSIELDGVRISYPKGENVLVTFLEIKNFFGII